MQERLQKILSQAGLASRREAEGIILDGRVAVNGMVVTELGTKADPDNDMITVDGKAVTIAESRVYVLLYKPVGYMTTMKDPEGRPTVLDLLKKVRERVYPVGRLDYNTEGLLLLTNDGTFANAMMHPSHEVDKGYLVRVSGQVSDDQIERLIQGVELDDGKTAPAKVHRVKESENNSWISITIHEGRYRQVRRMCEAVGLSVVRLKRSRYDFLEIGDLKPGEFRYLFPDEVYRLTHKGQAPAKEPRKAGERQQRDSAPRPTRAARPVDAERTSRSERSDRSPRSGPSERPLQRERAKPNQRLREDERPERRQRAAQGESLVQREPSRQAARSHEDKGASQRQRSTSGERPVQAPRHKQEPRPQQGRPSTTGRPGSGPGQKKKPSR